MKTNDFQEELFQAHIGPEKVKAARTLSLLASVLYGIFGIVDFYSLSITLEEVLFIRGGVVIVLIATFIFSYYESFEKFYLLIFSMVALSTSMGIEAMIYLSVPGDHAFNVYFAGIILVIMTIFGWGYLKHSTSLFVSGIIIAGYAFVAAVNQLELYAIFVNVFFLLSATSIGFISQLARDRYVREVFELQQSLAKAVKEKTIEADDFAYKANHDSLTSLPNRRYITQLLEESLQIAKDKDKVLAILFFDLNGFKPLNDIYGHAVGDEVLIIVAKRLELAIRKGDCASRLGGDEYLVGLMMDKDHVSEIEPMAGKFAEIISEPMSIDGNIVKVGASVGIAAYPMHGNNVNVLIDIADKKMYNVKQGLQKLDKAKAKAKTKNKSLMPVVIFPGNAKRRR
jgi:diguanylate cyclase (GGDEF)-like protein